jgi:hypothetical protein
MILGAWTPDLPPYGHDGLVTARNVFPSEIGYEPVKEYSAVTTALATTWRGGGTFRGIDGTIALLAGLNEGLYSYSSPTWTQEVAAARTAKWQFAQFGDLVICVQGGAPLKYTIASGAGTTLGGSPPSAAFVTTVKDFVVMAGVGSANSTVYWSAINNAEGWTPGTDQSDTQVLPDGGEVTGLAGGEYLLVFQRDQIWRAQYVGPPFIFTFDKIISGIGCIAAHSIIQAGRTVFFESGRGFYALTDGQLTPIGMDKIDKTFFDQYALADIETGIWSAVDPFRKLAIWAMPRRLWCYHWAKDRWSDIEGDFFGVATGATESYTYEQIAALYPSGMEAVPGSFDDPIWAGGEPFLMIAADDNTLGSFGSSTNLEATLKIAQIEPTRGRDTRVRAVRVDTDATTGVTINMDCRARLGNSPTLFTGNSIRTNGDMPVRASGRYIQPSIIFAEDADWTYIEGVNIVGAAAGGRQ